MEVIINMKKRLLPLLLLTTFIVGGCTTSSLVPISNDLNKNGEYVGIPPYTPPTPPEEPKNIESIDILGIPEDYRVAMGLFDEANIRCQITYTDSTTSTFQLLEENLPYRVREMLGQEGEHNVSIQIRGQKVSFKIIMVDEGIRYVVRFLNYNDDVLYMTKVMPDNKVQYLGDEPRRMSDVVYKYKYNGWDHDISTYLVDHSTDIYAQYDTVFKNNDYLPLDRGTEYVSEYKGVFGGTNERSYVCHYVGRMTNFQIARDRSVEYKEHTLGNKEVFNYSFDDTDSPIDPDIASPAYDYHPEITWSLPGAVSLSNKYVNPGESIDEKYIPYSPEFINYADINDVPFTVQSVRARNIEGKTYNTVVNDYKAVITEYLSATKMGDLLIPEDFPSGKYTATLFGDFDVYAFVYAEQTPVGVMKSGIYAVFCISDIYVGLNPYDNRIKNAPPKYSTSTYEEDMMNIQMFAPMMEYARSAFEE